MDDLANYLRDHLTEARTGYAGSAWEGAGAGRGCLYPYAPAYDPKEGEFVGLIRKGLEASPAPDPLDGEEHTLAEMSEWAPTKGLDLALRFISLGSYLKVFSLVEPEAWNPRERRPEESVDSWIASVEAQNKCRFRCRADLAGS